MSSVPGSTSSTPRTSHDAEPENDALLKPEQDLQEADAVLEKPEDVLQTLKEYLRAGGKVQTAVQHLSDGYMGYASMADLLVEWADLIDMPLGQLLGAGGAAGSGGSLSRAYSVGVGSGGSSTALLHSSSASGAAGAGGDAGMGQDGGAHLDVLLLQELVRERFDPTKFLSVFKAGHPAWLDQLIQHSHSRKMIYELSAANKNSLLLNYAIQRILKQGHEDEVAQVGGSLASYFDVYHRLLVSRLAAAARASDEKQLRVIAKEIVGSSADNQHTYVHAQALLAALAQLPAGSVVYRRLSEEVEAAAAERHGGIKVYQLQPLFVPPSASALESQAVQLVAAVLMESAPNLPGAGSAAQQGPGKQPFVAEQVAAAEHHLVALQQLYQQESQLSVQPLRHPRMMQLLLSGMYVCSDAKPSAMSRQTCSMRELCIRLLALAVAGRAPQGHAQQQPEHLNGQPQEAEGLDQHQQQQGEQRRSLSPEVRLHGGVEAVAGQLRESLALTKRMGSNKLLPKDLDSATQVCRLSVAALGLLQHSQHVLSDEALYAEEKVVVILPNHLSVLHRVACEQPGMIPQVLSVLRTVVAALGASHMELSRSVNTLLVSLIVSGASGPTLDLVQDWSKTADPSLLRHFIGLVLESVAPPYSEAFSRSLLGLMATSKFSRVEGNHAAVLREFALGCRDIPYRPPLSNELQTLLEHWGG